MPHLLAVLFTLLLGGILAGALAAPARADEPVHMPEQVVDTANVLSPQQEAEVSAAVERLADKKNVQLSVVYVHDFGNLSPAAWADRTGALSGLGYRDMLLAIAVNDRSFHLGSAEPIDDLPPEQIAKIAEKTVGPQVAAGDWTAAGVRTADELAGIRSHFWLWFTLALAALLVLLVGLIGWLYRRNTRRLAAAAAAESEVVSVDQLSAQSLDDLYSWSAEALVNADNAVSVSADELALAVDEYGEEATAPFAAALRTADNAVATAFRIRHEVDHQPGLGDDERRERLTRVIAICSDADGTLDQQAAAFDALRDLGTGAAGRLDALADRSAALAGRLALDAGDPVAGADSSIAAAVAGNAALAGELLQFADDSIEQGREADAGADTDRRSVIAAVRSAEAALDAAAKLLDAAVYAADTDAATGTDRATAAVNAAESYLDTRRGAVGSEARTCLSEAGRLLDQTGGGQADRAAALAAQAVELARADVAAAELEAAVLTGVLVDSVLATDAETVGAQLISGYSSGGRSPGSFGGSDTSGRIGTGGRR